MISVEGKALAQGEAIFQSITPIVVSKAVLQIHFVACYFWKQVVFQGKIGKCEAIKTRVMLDVSARLRYSRVKYLVCGTRRVILSMSWSVSKQILQQA